MIARAVIRSVAATLPAGARGRYREEWLADAGVAREHEVSAWSIVVGALGVAVGLDRENPLISGVTLRRLAFRRLRIAVAAGTSAGMLLVFGWLWGAFAPRGSAPLSWAGPTILTLVAVAGAIALVASFGALRARRRARGRRRWGAADVAVAVALAFAVAAMLFVPFLSVPLLFTGVLAFVVILLIEDPRSQAAPLRRPAAVAVALASAGGILVTLAGSLLHTFLWNPLARMPGMTLDEIYAGLAAARELPSPILPVAWAVLWCAVAITLVVLCALPQSGIRRFATARRIAGVGILGIALVAGGSWIIGFGMGMGMADAFATSGGDAAASGPVLALVGVIYGIAAVLVGLLPSRLTPPRVENAGELAG